MQQTASPQQIQQHADLNRKKLKKRTNEAWQKSNETK
jgi:hypothetical protein